MGDGVPEGKKKKKKQKVVAAVGEFVCSFDVSLDWGALWEKSQVCIMMALLGDDTSSHTEGSGQGRITERSVCVAF